MAQWNDFINLFPTAEQPVIQQFQSIVVNDFGYTTYSAFESNFGNISSSYFNALSTSHPFKQSLSSWLGNEAMSSSNWSHFQSKFNSYDLVYINLIIGQYGGSPVSSFAAEGVTARASMIDGISGFWNAYLNMIASYMQDVPEGVTITSHPSNQNPCIGASASFSVSATGSGLSYQWKKNGSNISGATASTYAIGSVNTSHAGNYTCEVTGSGGSATSNLASLTTKALVSITAQPQGATIIEGGAHTFSVTASGSGTLTYQWRKNGSNISGATSASYTINNAASSNGGTYSCRVTNSCGNVTSNNAVLTVEQATEISSHPANQNPCIGASASFSVTATGSGLSYQWKKGGSNISGATSSTYTIANVNASHAGNYTCEVSGTGGSVTSNAASLTTKALVSIAAQPQAATIIEGGTHTFSVTASGSGTLTYQWRKNGSNISGATSASYVINNATLSNGGTYSCVVTNSCGNATSNNAVLTVEEATEITSHPANQNPCPGASASFSVTAAGNALTYQWKKDGSNISGATSSTYTIASVNVSHEGNYTCEVSGTGGSVTSNAASLTAKDLVSITTPPQDATINWGDSHTFSVVATGDGPLSYQWRKNGVDISGATGSTYTLNNTTTADNGNYKCRVTNSCGNQLSTLGKLTVVENLSITTDPVNQEACPGSSATFSIVASGTDISYQWQKDGVNISGATSSSLTISNVNNSDEGNYRCIASISSGLTKTSAVASLTAKEEISITTQPQGATINWGDNHSFSVVATGDAPFSYQWRKNGIPISGAVNSTLALTATTLSDNADYDCIVSNACGSSTTAPATLTVVENLQITAQPANQTVCEGESATFSVVADGTDVSYQWQKDEVNISGATASSFTIATVANADEGSYRCVASIPSGLTKTSSAADLVTKNIKISTQPQDASINWGDGHTFEVIATGEAPIRYQWRRNGEPINGEIQSTLSLNDTTFSDGGIYDCELINLCGEVLSDPATLTVIDNLQITEQPEDVVAQVGAQAQLTLTAEGPNITYHWRKDGQIISSSNSPTYTITNVNQNDFGKYDCVLVLDSGLTKISTLIFLIMEGEIIITIQPESAVVNWSEPHALEVVVIGDAPIAYQWRKNGIQIQGANASVLPITNAQTSDEGEYDCIITNPHGEKVSAKATISVSSYSSEIAQVAGVVENLEGVPMENITVKVIDRLPGSSKILATVTTNAEGFYQAEYLKSELLNQSTLVANLVVELYEDGATEPSEISSLIENASAAEVVNFSTNAFVSAVTEYAAIDAYITANVSGGTALSDLSEEDIALLANKSFSKERIGFYIKADEFNTAVSAVSKEHFYGMLKQGLPQLIDVLATSSSAEVVNALIAASADNVIATIDETAAQAVYTALSGQAVTVVEQSENNPFKAAFEKVSLTTAQKNTIIQAHLNDTIGATDVWQVLIDDVNSGVDQADVDEIKRVVEIQDVVLNDGDLVAVLDSQVAAGTKLSDVAHYSLTQWEGLIDDSNASLLSIPSRYTGTEAERKTAFATDIRKSVEIVRPTDVFAKRANADLDINSTNLDDFVADKTDFKFGETKLATYLETSPLDGINYTNNVELVQKDLEAYERLYHIAPSINRFEAIKPLLQEDVTSSVKIATMGETRFVEKFGDQIGTKVAEEMYDKAMQTYGKVIHMAAKNNNTPGPLVIGDSLDTSQSVSGLADLETLFGSLDYCECTHCRSVYSAAAYMVDLLNFLEYEDASGTNTTIKAALLAKRAEIQDLHLNCANTNTPIPYIDIVNELLEKYISGDTTVFQTEHSAEVLRATPQNVNETVYTTLKSAVYPYNLPFNLGFEETKSYVKETGVGLGSLIAALPQGALTDAEHAALSAAASLGVSPQQLAIINGSSADTYLGLFDVANLSEVINPIGTFLEKANVSYEKFQELLTSKYINPEEKMIYFPGDGSCDLDNMTLGHNPKYVPDTDPAFNAAEGFSATELERFNRFLRLHMLSGWSVKDLDIAINALGQGGDKLNGDTIVKIHHLGKLKEGSKLEVEELVILWDDFDVHTYADVALFDKLFQDTTVNNQAASVVIPDLETMLSTAPTGLTLNDTDIKPLVCGATGLSSKELDFILAQGDINVSMNLSNLSYLFRISSFVQLSGISLEDYFEKRALLSLDGVSITSTLEPQDTISFIDKVNLVKQLPFTEDELAYLLGAGTSNTFSVPEEEVISFLESLQEDYDGLGIKFPMTADDLDAEIEDLIGLYIDDRTYIDGVIAGGPLGNIYPPTADQAFVDSLGNHILPGELDIFELDINYASAGTQRKVVIYNYLQRHHLIQTNVLPLIKEKLAALIDTPIDLAVEVLGLSTLQTTDSLEFIFTDINFLLNNLTVNSTDYAKEFRAIETANKASLVAKVLNVTAEELSYLVKDLPAAYTGLGELPVAGISGATFSNMEAVFSMRVMDGDLFTGKTLIEYLAQQTTANRLNTLAGTTQWSIEDITALVGASGFNYNATPDDFLEVEWIKKLKIVIEELGKLRMDAAAALGLNFSDPTTDTIFSLRNLLKARFGNKQWLEVAEKVHDPIREQKRDAMVAYLIATNTTPVFKNERALYDYFLIDTQMSACQLTSRIKQSVSAIQLFVQRINLGFEGDLSLNKAKMQEWQWRKNYRVWEANRKVFLYPENYLLPELRTNQSKLFTDFEEALTQEDVSSASVEKAYQQYLEGFLEIANLEINQMTYDENTKVLHVIANDHQSPKQFYYRTCTNQSIWTAWELIPMDVSGGVLPLMHRGKLMLFWKDIKELKEKPGTDYEIDPTDTPFKIPDGVSDSQYEVKLAWTAKTGSGWEPKKLTNTGVVVDNQKELSEMVLSPMFNEFSELFVTMMTYGNPNNSDIEPSYLTLEKAFKYELGDMVDIKFDDVYRYNVSSDGLFVRDSETLDATYMSGIGYPDFENWKDRRKLTLAEKSGVFYSGGNQSNNYIDQKLTLGLQNSFSIPYNGFVFSPDDAPANRDVFDLKIESSKVLTSFDQRKFTLIRSIEQELPLLAGTNWTRPFIMKDGEKYFIIFIERLAPSSDNKINSIRSTVRHNIYDRVQGYI